MEAVWGRPLNTDVTRTNKKKKKREVEAVRGKPLNTDVTRTVNRFFCFWCLERALKEP